jgi:hypothetical protein
MKKLNENVAFAKSILNKLGITQESPEFADFLKIREICGNNTGYVGILTKLRFIDKVSDMDEIQSIFDILKNSKIDINKLNKISYEEILDQFYDELTINKSDKTDIELYYRDDQYSYYKVYTYKGIMKIGSPSWCLKTKSNWDRYQNEYPEQWVVVDNRHKGSLLSPDSNYLSNYTNVKKPWIRYGISLKHNADRTISWTGNDDNNGSVDFRPKSWTFFGVMNTILNLTAGIKKSFYDRFVGCEQVNKTWHKVVDKDKFLERLDINKDKFNDEDELYVKFSSSYSFIPAILILNTYNFNVIFPTNKFYKEENALTKYATIESGGGKKIILDYIKDKDNPYFDGIKLKNNMTTIEDIKGEELFMGQFGKWLIFDRNDKYYLIVNTDVDEIQMMSSTLVSTNYEMDNPIAWYLDKKTMDIWKPSTINMSLKDFHKEVIGYIKDTFIKKQDEVKPEPIVVNIKEDPEETDKKVSGFWDFIKRKK